MIKRVAFEGHGIRVVSLWTVIIAGLLASGCSSLLVDVKYHKNPALEQKFAARPAAATVTRDDAKTLEKKGYFNIGRIDIWRPGSDKNTSWVPRLLKEAASVGGDVVYVEADNAYSPRAGVARGRCLSEISRTVSQDVPYQTPRRDSRGNITGYDTHYRSQTRTVKECVQWEQVPTTADGLVTSGTVWRYDPQMKTVKYDPQMKAMKEVSSDDLHKAAKEGQVELVKRLLEQGASVNAYDSEGYTALHRAVSENKREVVKILLDKGADVNAPSRTEGYYFEGAPPLMWASRFHDASLVKELVERGAKVDQADKYGNRALHEAAEQLPPEGPEVIKLLVALGSNVNWQNKDGNTSLMAAVYFPRVENVKVLLALGANKNLKDKDGRTAADWARIRMEELDRTKDDYAESKAKYMEIIRFLSGVELLGDKKKQAISDKNEFGGETLEKTYKKGDAGSEDVIKEIAYFDSNKKKVKVEYFHTAKLTDEKGFNKSIFYEPCQKTPGF